MEEIPMVAVEEVGEVGGKSRGGGARMGGWWTMGGSTATAML
jgi:hypothetical protein